MTLCIRSIIAGVGALALATPVRAQVSFQDTFDPPPPPEPNPYSYAWYDPRLSSGIGVGVTLGGGVTGFTEEALRDVVDDGVGGVWNVRVSIGTHIPLGLDLTYAGSAAQLQTLAEADNGALIGTAFEAALRYNILPLADGTPYVFAGAGWQRYDLRDPNFAQADTGMRGSDDVAVFPMGAGAAYRDPSGWVGDVRGTFRATTTSSLLTPPSGDHPRLHSWEASAAIGYEF